MTDDNGNTDLAIRGTGALAEVLAALVGVSAPGVAAGLVGLSAGTALIDAVRDRRRSRFEQRLRFFVEHLQRRVDAMEREYSDEDVDLFVEVLEKAIADDEEPKAAIYAAVLDWMQETRPTHAETRVLSDAVRSLSYLELYCFLASGRLAGRRWPLGEEVQTARLANAGLLEVDVSLRGGDTAIAAIAQGYRVSLEFERETRRTEHGNVLTKYCRLDDLPVPDVPTQ